MVNPQPKYSNAFPLIKKISGKVFLCPASPEAKKEKAVENILNYSCARSNTRSNRRAGANRDALTTLKN